MAVSQALELPFNPVPFAKVALAAFLTVCPLVYNNKAPVLGLQYIPEPSEAFKLLVQLTTGLPELKSTKIPALPEYQTCCSL